MNLLFGLIYSSSLLVTVVILMPRQPPGHQLRASEARPCAVDQHGLRHDDLPLHAPDRRTQRLVADDPQLGSGGKVGEVGWLGWLGWLEW